MNILVVFFFLFIFSTTIFAKDHQKQINCLAKNIYYEARGESELGQKAIAFVTINRTKSDKYPNDICKVVYDPGQFSWTQRKKHLTISDKEEYNEILDLAEEIYFNHHRLKDFTNGSMYFHATYIKPSWKGLKKSIKIGRHIFYRE